jgi:uncharacterized oxidoreductase
MDMSGNVIFITGGGTGIGRGLAIAFHKLGAKVIIAGRRQAPLMETADAHPGMDHHEIDMRDHASIERVAAWLKKHHPDCNVIINNAGIMGGDSTGSGMDDQKMLAMVETNLLGPMRLTSALIEHLKSKPSACVVNVTSGLAFTPLAHTAVYSATKAALHSWTLSLRFRLKGTSVRVREIAPPWVRTDLMGSRDETSAMPLDDFIAETMAKFATDADEVLVDRVRMLRDNPGPDEWAFVDKFNGMMAH